MQTQQQTTQTQRASVAADQLQQAQAGIRRMRLLVESLDNDIARMQRVASTLADVLGWQHSIVAALDGEIAQRATRRDRQLADIKAMSRALRALSAE